MIYYFSPNFRYSFFVGLVVISLLEWFRFLWDGFIYFFFLACIRLGVYIDMIAVWSSNSGYCLLCVFPALAQTISYEVTLAFILLSFVILICRYNLVYFYTFQVYLWLILFSLPLSFILVYFFVGWE